MKKYPRSILVATNHLKDLGGSETFAYTLIGELKRLGFEVEYFTFYKGLVSDKIENDLGAGFMSKKKYDLILANHNSCVKYLVNRGFIIQTCHGVFPELEQPSSYAHKHVAISKEVQEHLQHKHIKSKIILNGINLERFKAAVPLQSELKTVLSLCHSDEANQMIAASARELGAAFIYLNKYENPGWNVEQLINQADLVVGVGRSAYEAMACGRPVVIFDSRSYYPACGDGYVKEILEESILKNCSGRYYGHSFTIPALTAELKKFKKEDGAFFREFALKNLNITNSVLEYIRYFGERQPLSLKRGWLWAKRLIKGPALRKRMIKRYELEAGI
ncbi:glycosyltransferase [Niabella soli]|uniref:UDP-glycosyltransferase n=1 Tax=Niabella soli DSM 19437 TaxID=929713 RepID=W0F005_9BACT|nr:UDP-glycosyltransferase [Niabella soli]AHF14779.1 UDP-glycosyltransferase [Niabella soli DSM 19437]